MLFVLTLALFVGLASSRPSDKAIVDIDPRNKYCGCSTVDLPQCGCCVDLEEIIQENYTVCTNLTYVEAEYGVRFTLTVNGQVLLNETISGRNPPALCEGLKDVADICVQVYNMSYEEEKFGGCLRIYGDLVTRILDIELGCYYIPLSDGQLIETAVDEQALVHSLFQIGNSAKDVILDEMHKWSHKDGDLEPDFVEDNSCGCNKDPVPQCGCCGEFEFDGKHHNVCMNMTYIKEEKGLRFTIVFDDEVLLNKTISATNPPAFCQGICPAACICEKYYNMSYGDDDKWGGCLEIYGDLLIQVLDIQFGCYYLPVKQAEQKPTADNPNQSVFFNDIQQWYRNTLAKKMRDRRLKKKNPLHFLYNNRVEEDN